MDRIARRLGLRGMLGRWRTVRSRWRSGGGGSASLGVADLFATAQEDGAETDANAPESVEAWLTSAGRLVEKYFTLEDPTVP